LAHWAHEELVYTDALPQHNGQLVTQRNQGHATPSGDRGEVRRFVALNGNRATRLFL